MPRILLAGGCAFAQSSPPGLLGEDGWISVRNSGLRFNRTTNTFDATVTLVNLNSKPIQGPFYLGVSGISDSEVSLAKFGGDDSGAYRVHPAFDSGAACGRSTAGWEGVLKFNNPSVAGFQFNSGIWDAVSLGIPVNMSCPAIPGDLGPGNYTYPTHIDYYGRQASCVPASASSSPVGNRLIQCVTGGAGSPYDPGHCNCSYPVGAPLSGGGVNLTTTDLSLGPRQQVSPTPAGEIVLSGGTYNHNAACVEPATGTATFSIANNGLYTATDVVLSIGVPKQFVVASAVQFSQAATCKDIGPGNFPDGTAFTQGDILDCTFASLNAGEMIQATVGYDTPPNARSTSLWALNACVSSETPDPDTTNNAIGFSIYYPHRLVFPPVTPSCKHGPDDHTFAVLLDTCGVPRSPLKSSRMFSWVRLHCLPAPAKRGS